MARQIIMQPNGKYCVFSTIVDGIILYDYTRSDLIGKLITDEIDRIYNEVQNICDQLDKGELPYFHSTMTWEEAKEKHEERHGPLVLEKNKGESK